MMSTGNCNSCAIKLKMRLIVVAVVALAACASALEVVSLRGYHAEIGIPLAAKIRETEAKILSNGLIFQDERIIGGVQAPVNAHPYFAGLLIDMNGMSQQSVCGASLLSTNRLVTAAHCWSDGVRQAWRFTVILGTQFLYQGGTRVPTTSVIMHPQWTSANLLNDVAMIYLPSHINLNARIQPISLPAWNEGSTFLGEWANAVGFGATSDSQPGASTVLSHVNLQVISEQQCRAIYGASFVFASTLCTNGAGGVGVCGGDSGGPLAIQRNGQNVLIGISSFAANNACERGFPSGFARVTSFLNFITQHMR